MTPLNLVTKKTVLIIAFKIDLTFDVNIVCGGCQVAVCVQKRQKKAILGVVCFKSSTLTTYCWSSWFVHQQRKTHSNLCVLCQLSNLSWFQGPKYILPSFWFRVTNHDVKSNISKKWFFGHCSFSHYFHDVEMLRRKRKIFVKVIQRFWYAQYVGLIF